MSSALLHALPGLACPWSALSLCSQIPPSGFRVVAAAWETTVSCHPSPSPGENNRISKLQGRPARLLFSRQQHVDCVLVAGIQMEMGARGRQSLTQLVFLGPLSAPGRGHSVFEAWEGIYNRSMWTPALACTDGSEIWHPRRAVSDGKCLMFALERIWGQADRGSSYVTGAELTVLQHLFAPSSKPYC